MRLKLKSLEESFGLENKFEQSLFYLRLPNGSKVNMKKKNKKLNENRLKKIVIVFFFQSITIAFILRN